eukprot:3561456-Amphidinium_carterae.1
MEILILLCAGVVVSSYFDDFVVLEPNTTTSSATKVLEGFLQAIGWLYDKDGDKYVSFSKSAE